MKIEEVFERYSHLVPKAATKYNLDEDQTQELWLALWEYLNTHSYPTYKDWCSRIHAHVESHARFLGSKSVAYTDTPLDNIAYVEPLATVGMREALDAALETLSPRQELVLRMRYFEHRTLVEVGKCLNVSGDRVRQIAAKALRKMRDPARRKRFGYEAYWDETPSHIRYLEVSYGTAQDESDCDCG